MPTRTLQWLFWPTAVLLVVGTTAFLWYNSRPHRHGSPVHTSGKKDPATPPNDDDSEDGQPALTPGVKVVKARYGAMEHVTVQVGSVEADEVQLHSMVTGILKKQTVLIGQHVKKGNVLAVIDVPELEKQVERNAAVVEHAKARVKQMEAKVVIARADLKAAEAQIVYAEANAKAAAPMLAFRTMYHQRMKDLFATNSIELQLVDESKERKDAARESENAAKAAVFTARAQAMSADAKIQLCRADVVEAEAQVKIASAELGKSEAQFNYATIVAPFDGIITQRAFYLGAVVRAAGTGGNPLPMLTVQRTDSMRVIVQIPDTDAHAADPGDSTQVEHDGVKYAAKISRIARVEDPQTRLMHVEIDLPNPKGRIRQGMFGKVTILLDSAANKLSLESACLKGKAENGEGTVLVVRAGKVQLTKIKIGGDNGKRVEVLAGLTKDDEVILQSPASLSDGTEVQATLVEEPQKQATNPR